MAGSTPSPRKLYATLLEIRICRVPAIAVCAFGTTQPIENSRVRWRQSATPSTNTHPAPLKGRDEAPSHKPRLLLHQLTHVSWKREGRDMHVGTPVAGGKAAGLGVAPLDLAPLVQPQFAIVARPADGHRPADIGRRAGEIGKGVREHLAEIAHALL